MIAPEDTVLVVTRGGRIAEGCPTCRHPIAAHSGLSCEEILAAEAEGRRVRQPWRQRLQRHHTPPAGPVPVVTRSGAICDGCPECLRPLAGHKGFTCRQIDRAEAATRRVIRWERFLSEAAAIPARLVTRPEGWRR